MSQPRRSVSILSGNGEPRFGRSEAEWQLLEDEGLRFLVDCARRGATTTYSELNDMLATTGSRRFDFSQENERAQWDTCSTGSLSVTVP